MQEIKKARVTPSFTQAAAADINDSNFGVFLLDEEGCLYWFSFGKLVFIERFTFLSKPKATVRKFMVARADDLCDKYTLLVGFNFYVIGRIEVKDKKASYQDVVHNSDILNFVVCDGMRVFIQCYNEVMVYHLFSAAIVQSCKFDSNKDTEMILVASQSQYILLFNGPNFNGKLGVIEFSRVNINWESKVYNTDNLYNVTRVLVHDNKHMIVFGKEKCFIMDVGSREIFGLENIKENP